MTKPPSAADVASMWKDVTARADALERASSDLVQIGRRSRPGAWAPFSIQKASSNSKIAPQRQELAKSRRIRFVPVGPYVASTYSSIAATCPDSCRFRNNGCFAQAGAHHLTMGRLDRASRGLSALEVTRREAEAVAALWPRGIPQDGARGGRDLRLYVGGDTSCTSGARALGDAAEAQQSRGLGRVWTYTHRWKTIARDAWGPIQIFASVENADDLVDAVRRGYAPALTVSRFPSDRAFTVRGTKIVPCPHEAHPSHPTCATCRLCLDGALIDHGLGVGFQVHGRDEDQANLAIGAA